MAISSKVYSNNIVFYTDTDTDTDIDNSKIINYV
jgi:hypothetical protein